MGKKTGRKAKYVLYGGTEVVDIVEGETIGISQHKHTLNFYVMLPTAAGKKMQWLGSDLANAVIKYRAIISNLKKEPEVIRVSIPEKHVRRIKERATIMTENKFSVPESYMIEWLKKELQNPKKFAKKTGIGQLANLEELVPKEYIKLSDLLQNYLTKKKSISTKEVYNTDLFWKTFVKAIDCKSVDEIKLPDDHSLIHCFGSVWVDVR